MLACDETKPFYLFTQVQQFCDPSFFAKVYVSFYVDKYVRTSVGNCMSQRFMNFNMMEF